MCVSCQFHKRILTLRTWDALCFLFFHLKSAACSPRARVDRELDKHPPSPAFYPVRNSGHPGLEGGTWAVPTGGQPCGWSLLSCSSHLGLPVMEDRRQLSSLGLGMFALGLAQAEGIWMLLQPAGSRLCCRVDPLLGEGWEMVTMQSEAGTCSLSGDAVCSSQRGPCQTLCTAPSCSVLWTARCGWWDPWLLMVLN